MTLRQSVREALAPRVTSPEIAALIEAPDSVLGLVLDTVDLELAELRTAVGTLMDLVFDVKARAAREVGEGAGTRANGDLAAVAGEFTVKTCTSERMCTTCGTASLVVVAP